MRWMRCHALDLVLALLVVSIVGATAWNADVVRLAAGAFGPPPAVVISGACAGALLLTGAAAWWRQRADPTRSRSLLVSLAVAAAAALAAERWQGRDVATRTMTFEGADISYAATLYHPAEAGPWPLLVVVHGSAPLKRGFYGLWAEHLARAGFAVLVADKRGVGGTGGQFERMDNTSRENIDRLAGDVVTAVEFAARQPEVDARHIGLFGLSQAGWVAPVAATRTPLVRYLVMITAPTVSVHEEGAWSRWRGDDAATALASRPDAERMMDTVASRGVDARAPLGVLEIPGLWLFGADDNSIPSLKSVHVLDSLRTHAGRAYASVMVPGAGHLLFVRDRGAVPRVAPATWATLVEWLNRTVDRQSTAPRTRGVATVSH
jgi:dienelactone hydrolase